MPSRAMALSAIVASRGGIFVVVNSVDRRTPPFASMFVMEEAALLRDTLDAEDVVFDQWCVGLEYRKPMQLLMNSLEVVKAFRDQRCEHPRGSHRPMRGRDFEGGFMTKSMSRYPHPLCEKSAEAVLKEFCSRPPASTTDRAPPKLVERDPRIRWVKQRAPTASMSWNPIRRWFEVFRVKWRRLEHNNIGELRIAVMSLRHIARSRKNWSRRHLIFTDSLVTLGALAKGRSSSWPLLRLTGEAAALQLILDLRPYWRYIETDRNVADGPSRGYGVGHAPPSVSARDWDLQQQFRA